MTTEQAVTARGGRAAARAAPSPRSPHGHGHEGHRLEHLGRARHRPMTSRERCRGASRRASRSWRCSARRRPRRPSPTATEGWARRRATAAVRAGGSSRRDERPGGRHSRIAEGLGHALDPRGHTLRPEAMARAPRGTFPPNGRVHHDVGGVVPVLHVVPPADERDGGGCAPCRDGPRGGRPEEDEVASGTARRTRGQAATRTSWPFWSVRDPISERRGPVGEAGAPPRLSAVAASPSRNRLRSTALGTTRQAARRRTARPAVARPRSRRR